jgi:hypothetical protein
VLSKRRDEGKYLRGWELGEIASIVFAVTLVWAQLLIEIFVRSRTLLMEIERLTQNQK